MVRLRTLMRYLFLAFLLTYFATSTNAQTCTFIDWDWHSEAQRAVNFREVKIERDQLTPDQYHPTIPCSICREDQKVVRIGSAKTRVCQVIAQDVQEALTLAVDAGFEIETLVGYRVGKTKGPLSPAGLRTQYSNHAFGLAIDINPERNGLYDQCTKFSSKCRLKRGGHWHPGRTGTVTQETVVYQFLKGTGLNWGGELQGYQKDFMHFSLTGD